jgi:EAL domain-containing protein (putative c-di-GMP-specific phosphodiesterase class I)
VVVGVSPEDFVLHPGYPIERPEPLGINLTVRAGSSAPLACRVAFPFGVLVHVTSSGPTESRYSCPKNSSTVCVHKRVRIHIRVLSDFGYVSQTDHIFRHHSGSVPDALPMAHRARRDGGAWGEHPTLGHVNPSEFVAIAESTDLIRPLTEFTLSEALAQAARWRRAGVALRVAVNLSARMLHDPELARRLASLIGASGVDSASLEVEITESAVMLDPPRALRIVREIHELGVLVSIDDYGAGFSALGYLRDLPVHGLKLDKSFVGGMQTRKGDRVIVESTVRMAHALELQVVAEGVESDWDLQIVARAGCDFAQGFHFSPPLPAGACAQWITSFNSAATRTSAQYSDTGKSRSRTGNRTVQ